MTVAEPAIIDDLPRRTWQRWWRELPGYYRIAAWSALAVLGLHCAVAVRMYFGWQEAAVVKQFRRGGVTVRYFWEGGGERFRGEDVILAGLFGRSPGNVSRLQIEYGLQRDDLPSIKAHFPSLRQLVLSGVEFDSSDLHYLSNCRRVELLSLAHTDVDDSIAEHLLRFPRLERLNLKGTLVSDATVDAVEHRLPSVIWIDVDATDASLAKTFEFHQSRYPGAPMSRSGVNPASATVGVICWADGRKSASFKGPYEFHFERQPDLFVEAGESGTVKGQGWRRDSSWSAQRGEYRVTLKLGEFSSLPVTVNCDGMFPVPHHVEYVMPVTREEALRSIAE